MYTLLEPRLGPGRLHHRRSVMHHHEPIVAHSLEDVGGQYLRFHGAIVAALGEIFFDDNHREVAGHDDIDIADVESHLKHAFENALPAFHHRAPSRQFAPPRMDTNDLAILEPDLLHVLDLETFERAIEFPVRFDYSFVVGHADPSVAMCISA